MERQINKEKRHKWFVKHSCFLETDVDNKGIYVDNKGMILVKN